MHRSRAQSVDKFEFTLFRITTKTRTLMLRPLFSSSSKSKKIEGRVCLRLDNLEKALDNLEMTYQTRFKVLPISPTLTKTLKNWNHFIGLRTQEIPGF